MECVAVPVVYALIETGVDWISNTVLWFNVTKMGRDSKTVSPHFNNAADSVEPMYESSKNTTVLSFGELEFSAGTFLTVFLTLFHSWISCE